MGPPLVAAPEMEEVAIAVASRLPEEDADRRSVGDGFGVDEGRSRRGGDWGFGVYLTALMVSVKVPEGTLTVTLSPFLRPMSARPTGESTEIRPAEGSLSTAPTRW